jgi:hypothetical protein
MVPTTTLKLKPPGPPRLKVGQAGSKIAAHLGRRYLDDTSSMTFQRIQPIPTTRLL